MLFIFYLWTGLWTVSKLVSAKEITLVGVANPGGSNSDSNFGPVSVVVKTDSSSFERDNQARIQDFEPQPQALLPSAISRLLPPTINALGKIKDGKSPILTPHQIQYFTNELLSLIGSKCRKVDGSKISKIQSYLSDVTSLDFSALKSFLPFLSPSSGAENINANGKDNLGADAPSPSWFESLINSLQTCAKSETPSTNDDVDDILSQYQQKQQNQNQNDARPEDVPEPESEMQYTEQEKEQKSKSSEEENAYFEQGPSESEPETRTRTKNNKKLPATLKPRSKPIITSIDEHEDSSSEQEVEHELELEQEQQQEREHQQQHQHEQEQRKKPKKNPIINWLHKAFTNVTSFFKQAFTHAKKSLKGLGDKLKRAKQSLLSNHKDTQKGKSHEEDKVKEKGKETPDPLFNLDLDSETDSDSGSGFGTQEEQDESRVRSRRSLAVHHHRRRRLAPPSLSDLDLADLLNGIFNPSGQKSAGKQMLKQILRDAFRIYGRSCPNLTPANIQAFRVTAKSFMNFIKQSEQLAFFITAVIDKNLVEAIRQCQKDNIGLKRK